MIFRRIRERVMRVEVEELPLKISVGKLALKPGDVVVMRTELMLNKDQIEALRQRFNEYFPDNKVMILTGGLKLSVITMVDDDASELPKSG